MTSAAIADTDKECFYMQKEIQAEKFRLGLHRKTAGLTLKRRSADLDSEVHG